jgi:hypothetical protein
MLTLEEQIEPREAVHGRGGHDGGEVDEGADAVVRLPHGCEGRGILNFLGLGHCCMGVVVRRLGER